MAEAIVYIVDDDPEVRRAVSLLVRSVHLGAIAYGTASEFLDGYDATKPGCLVLDMRIPEMTGLELQKKLACSGIHLPIIFITAYGEISTATEAMRAGALDFIPKPFSPQALLERIHEALTIDRDYRKAELQQQDLKQRLERLTDREREIMQMLAAGIATKVIAARLLISPKTVDNHRAKILEKMGVENSAQLARLLSNTK